MTDLEVPATEIAHILQPALGLSKPDDDEGQQRFMSSCQTEMLARPTVPGLPTAGIWRVRGHGWSAILKVLRAPGQTGPWAGHPDPAHPFYWRREAEAFEMMGTRLSCAEPGQGDERGVRMPRCYGVSDRADGSVAIWMEDVHGRPASDWDLPRYARFARQFARFHLAPTTRSLTAGEPHDPSSSNGADRLPRGTDWLGRQWLRTYLGRRDQAGDVLSDPGIWRSPAVREVLDVDRADEFLWLWQRRYDYLAEVEAQPRVLCHLDLHPLNLFDVDGETVLIDWAFCGIGGLGEDLGALAVDAITDFHLEPDRIAPLFETLVTNYAAASPVHDEATVRAAVASAALARFAWLAPALISALIDGRERINGRPAPRAAPSWAAACHFLLELADPR